VLRRPVGCARRGGVSGEPHGEHGKRDVEQRDGRERRQPDGDQTVQGEEDARGCTVDPGGWAIARKYHAWAGEIEPRCSEEAQLQPPEP
jgi:hypothetical protein